MCGRNEGYTVTFLKMRVTPMREEGIVKLMVRAAEQGC
jgi:hypothetical protein